MFIEKQRERKQDRIIYSRNGKQFGSWVNNHRIPYHVPAIARNLGEWWARDTSWVPREHLFGLYMVQVWGVKRQAGRCTWMFTQGQKLESTVCHTRTQTEPGSMQFFIPLLPCPKLGQRVLCPPWTGATLTYGHDDPNDSSGDCWAHLAAFVPICKTPTFPEWCSATGNPSPY